MTQSVGPLDFFIVEATEYVETLDALLGTATRAGPDPERFGRAARGLRGSATMARQYGLADLASSLERGARALRESRLHWEPGVHAAFVAAVDDLRILLRAVRAWGVREEERVLNRLADLDRIVPASDPVSRETPRTAGAGAAFLANQAGQLADALERFHAHPGDQEALDHALERARTLRGVATLRDLPPLPDIVDAIDEAGKHIALAARPATATQLALFDAAAGVLRIASKQIASGGRPEPGSVSLQLFALALAALAEEEGGSERIVPITELFPQGTTGIIHAASHPPTTAAQRFRLEVVSQAEHLRSLLADARVPHDSATGARMGRELGDALEELAVSAESFDERKVSGLVRELTAPILAGDRRAITAMEGAARLLADPSVGADALARQLDQLRPVAAPVSAAASGPSTSVRAAVAPPEPTPPEPRPATTKRRTPSGRELHDALSQGIEGFAPLDAAPLGAPVPLAGHDVVPIETLLYRGRAALDRARELREEIRRADRGPDPDALQELYDLIELAAAE